MRVRDAAALHDPRVPGRFDPHLRVVQAHMARTRHACLNSGYRKRGVPSPDGARLGDLRLLRGEVAIPLSSHVLLAKADAEHSAEEGRGELGAVSDGLERESSGRGIGQDLRDEAESVREWRREL